MDIYRAGEEFLLVDRPNVTLVTDATVLKVLTNETGDAASGVLVTSIDGSQRELFADTVVLAASAIENPRLLMLSRDVKPAGLGNDHDQVGRYLMDHPGGQVGRFPLETLGPIKKRFGFYSLSHKGHALMYMPGLAMTDVYQEASKELNSSVFFLMERAEDNPFDALRRLLHRDTSNRWHDLKSIVSNIGLVLAAVGQKALQSGKVPHGVKTFVSNIALRISPNFVVEEFETRGVPHKITGVKMFALSEQPPNPENRVVLSDEVDAFGQPVPKVIWRVGEQPRKTLAHLANVVSDELEKSGLPRPGAGGLGARKPPRGRGDHRHGAYSGHDPHGGGPAGWRGGHRLQSARRRWALCRGGIGVPDQWPREPDLDDCQRLCAFGGPSAGPLPVSQQQGRGRVIR